MKQNKISDEIDIYSLTSLQLKACWVINHLSNEDKDRFSSSEIANFLVEIKGINVSRQAVNASLTRHKDLFHKDKKGYFKLMKKGVEELENHSAMKNVIMIDSGKPFTAKNINLSKIFKQLKGVIRICDPYSDLSTLDVIFNSIEKDTSVILLTAKIVEKVQGSFKRQIDDLQKEGYKIEVRIYSNSQLHDRYIIDDFNFWLSGNSLNFLGNKESFIVSLGEDVRSSMSEVFNRRWKIAQPI